MQKTAMIATLALAALTFSGCAPVHDPSNGRFCPPGQAKKGHCTCPPGQAKKGNCYSNRFLQLSHKITLAAQNVA